MIKIYKTDFETNQFVETDVLEKGCWVNLVNPTEEELNRVHMEANIENTFTSYLLDTEERARIDIEDDQTLIIVDVPIVDSESHFNIYTTIPFGMLIFRDEIFVTICSKPLMFLEDFYSGKVKTFCTYKKTRFILQLLFRIAGQYLSYIKHISKEMEKVENDLQKTLRNKELIKMLNLEKSLVYFTTSLKSNEIVMEKLLRSKVIRLYDEDEDILEDAIVENKQAIEMTKTHSDILNGTMDAYSSVIANNLNVMMKFLTSITIVLSVPTIIGSLYGMNVSLPFANNKYAFLIIMITAFIISFFTYKLLKDKNML